MIRVGGIAAVDAKERSASRLAGPRVDGPRTWVVLASVLIAALVALASVLGLFTPWPYDQETPNWVLQAWGQDVGNLIAATALVTSAVATRRGSARARQIWIGTLAYFLYAYAVYAFAVHFSRLFVVYVAILGLVFWSLIAGLRARDLPLVYAAGRIRVFAASVLLGTGAMFALLWLSELVPATISGRPPLSLEAAGLVTNPIYVIDLAVVLPGMILIGVLALRRKEEGLAFVLPALMFSVLMGSSIIAATLLILGSGDASGLVPLILVTVVVGVSLWASVSWASKMGQGSLAHDER